MDNDLENYKLILLEKEHLRYLYEWNAVEKNFEQFTCRPVCKLKPFDEYSDKMMDSMNSTKEKNYILVKNGDCRVPLGKIRLFDYNPRNRSAEFGYYFPERNRSKGLGSIMLSRFLDISFADNDLKLNKLYATTSSNNIPSIKLLVKHGFILDGRLREHYWIKGDKYDQCVYSIIKSEWESNYVEG